MRTNNASRYDSEEKSLIRTTSTARTRDISQSRVDGWGPSSKTMSNNSSGRELSRTPRRGAVTNTPTSRLHVRSESVGMRSIRNNPDERVLQRDEQQNQTSRSINNGIHTPRMKMTDVTPRRSTSSSKDQSMPRQPTARTPVRSMNDSESNSQTPVRSVTREPRSAQRSMTPAHMRMSHLAKVNESLANVSNLEAVKNSFNEKILHLDQQKRIVYEKVQAERTEMIQRKILLQQELDDLAEQSKEYEVQNEKQMYKRKQMEEETRQRELGIQRQKKLDDLVKAKMRREGRRSDIVLIHAGIEAKKEELALTKVIHSEMKQFEAEVRRLNLSKSGGGATLPLSFESADAYLHDKQSLSRRVERGSRSKSRERRGRRHNDSLYETEYLMEDDEGNISYRDHLTSSKLQRSPSSTSKAQNATQPSKPTSSHLSYSQSHKEDDLLLELDQQEQELLNQLSGYSEDKSNRMPLFKNEDGGQIGGNKNVQALSIDDYEEENASVDPEYPACENRTTPKEGIQKSSKSSTSSNTPKHAATPKSSTSNTPKHAVTPKNGATTNSTTPRNSSTTHRQNDTNTNLSSLNGNPPAYSTAPVDSQSSNTPRVVRSAKNNAVTLTPRSTSTSRKRAEWNSSTSRALPSPRPTPTRVIPKVSAPPLQAPAKVTTSKTFDTASQYPLLENLPIPNSHLLLTPSEDRTTTWTRLAGDGSLATRVAHPYTSIEAQDGTRRNYTHTNQIPSDLPLSPCKDTQNRSFRPSSPEAVTPRRQRAADVVSVPPVATVNLSGKQSAGIRRTPTQYNVNGTFARSKQQNFATPTNKLAHVQRNNATTQNTLRNIMCDSQSPIPLREVNGEQSMVDLALLEYEIVQQAMLQDEEDELQAIQAQDYPEYNHHRVSFSPKKVTKYIPTNASLDDSILLPGIMKQSEVDYMNSSSNSISNGKRNVKSDDYEQEEEEDDNDNDHIFAYGEVNSMQQHPLPPLPTQDHVTVQVNIPITNPPHKQQHIKPTSVEEHQLVHPHTSCVANDSRYESSSSLHFSKYVMSTADALESSITDQDQFYARLTAPRITQPGTNTGMNVTIPSSHSISRLHPTNTSLSLNASQQQQSVETVVRGMQPSIGDTSISLNNTVLQLNRSVLPATIAVNNAMPQSPYTSKYRVDPTIKFTLPPPTQHSTPHRQRNIAGVAKYTTIKQDHIVYNTLSNPVVQLVDNMDHSNALIVTPYSAAQDRQQQQQQQRLQEEDEQTLAAQDLTSLNITIHHALTGDDDEVEYSEEDYASSLPDNSVVLPAKLSIHDYGVFVPTPIFRKPGPSPQNIHLFELDDVQSCPNSRAATPMNQQNSAPLMAQQHQQI